MNGHGRSFKLSLEKWGQSIPKDENFLQHKFIYGQDVGYQETDFNTNP